MGKSKAIERRYRMKPKPTERDVRTARRVAGAPLDCDEPPPPVPGAFAKKLRDAGIPAEALELVLQEVTSHVVYLLRRLGASVRVQAAADPTYDDRRRSSVERCALVVASLDPPMPFGIIVDEGFFSMTRPPFGLPAPQMPDGFVTWARGMVATLRDVRTDYTDGPATIERARTIAELEAAIDGTNSAMDRARNAIARAVEA